MPFEVGDILARVGFKVDDSGADRFDRRYNEIRRKAADKITAHAELDVDHRGFDRFDKSVRQANRAQDDFVRGSGRVRTSLGSLFVGGAGVAAAATAFYGLAKGATAAFTAFKESEAIGRQTEQVIKTTGGAAGVTAVEVGKLAESLSRKQAIDDEVVQSGANLLLTFTNVRNEVGKGNDIFNQATELAGDMSKALGQDVKSSAIQLGKALNDPVKGVTALQRVGVSFTKDQRAQIETLVESGKTLDAQKLILAELAKEFGGTAEATATNSERLKVSIGNIAEAAGGVLSPAVEKAAGWLDRLIGQFQRGEGTGGKIRSTLSSVADSAGRLVGALRGSSDATEGWEGTVARVSRQVRDSLGDVRDFAGRAFNFLVSLYRENRQRLEDFAGKVGSIASTIIGGVRRIRDAFSDTFSGDSGIASDVRNIVRHLVQFYNTMASVVGNVTRRQIPGIVTAFKGVAEVIRGVVRVVSGILTGDFGKAWDGVKDLFRGSVKLLAGLVRAGTAPVRAAAAAVGNAVWGALDDAWNFALRQAAGFVNRVIGILNKIPGVNIGKVSWGSTTTSTPGSDAMSKGATGGAKRSGNFMEGGRVDVPIAIMGEEAPEHPEWVIPTNPRYRQRAVGLWMAAAREIGIPGFALGGILDPGRAFDFVKGLPGKTVRSAAGLAGKLIPDLPANPGGLLGGAFGFVLNKAKSFISDKAGDVWDAAKGLISGGGGGGAPGDVHGLLPRVLAALAFARSHGWAGSVTSGWRSRAEQSRLYDLFRRGLGNKAAPPGQSNHEGGEAVDVSDPSGFARAMAMAPAGIRLFRRVAGEPWHFSITGYRKGGKTKPKKPPAPVLSTGENRGIRRSLARGERGIAPYERAIQGLEREYGQMDRRFGLSDEDWLIEHDDGSVTVDQGIVFKRLNELHDLGVKRKEILDKINAYRRAIARLMKRLRDAIKALRAALKAATGKARQKERGGYREAIASHVDRLAELKGVHEDLGFDAEDSRIDLSELAKEYREVRDATGQPADPVEEETPGADDPGTDPGAGAPAGEPPSAVADAQAIAEQATRRADALAAAVRVQETALRTFGGPGDFGAGGPGNAFAAAGGRGLPGSLPGEGVDPLGIAGGVVVVQQFGMLAPPKDPATLRDLGESAAAGLAYATPNQTPRVNLPI